MRSGWQATRFMHDVPQLLRMFEGSVRHSNELDAVLINAGAVDSAGGLRYHTQALLPWLSGDSHEPHASIVILACRCGIGPHSCCSDGALRVGIEVSNG